MIKGIHFNQVLVELNNSTFEFHITGSRFFGGNHEYSDYDFYAQDSEAIRNWLQTNKFRLLKGYESLDLVNYHDKNIAVVYERDDVHIQLQNDVESKHKAQKMMYVFQKAWKDLPKHDRVYFWNQCYKIIETF